MVDNNLIFVPFSTPSLKNSKVKTSKGIFSSKTVVKYLRLLGIQSYSSSKRTVKGYVSRPNLFEELRPQFEEAIKDIEPPYDVGFHFIRESKRTFDFNNVNQIVADLMTAHCFIEDDDIKNFLPYPLKIDGMAYSINKTKPGAYLYFGTQSDFES